MHHLHYAHNKDIQVCWEGCSEGCSIIVQGLEPDYKRNYGNRDAKHLIWGQEVNLPEWLWWIYAVDSYGEGRERRHLGQR